MNLFTPITRAGIAIIALVAAACTSTPPPTIEFPLPDFRSIGPIALEIAELDVSSDYAAPLTQPNVDHEFPVTLSSAATSWANGRLSAVGVTGRADFIIEDASVTETALDTTGGVTGLLKDELAYRYDGRLAVRLIVTRGHDTGEVEVVVTRSQTMLENVTVNERTAIWYQMMDQMMVDLNTEMETNIDLYLQAFIR